MKITYKSLYPNITLEHNIAPNTLIGRITIPEKVYEYENMMNDPKFQRSGLFIENMVCDNNIVFCNRWFKLANFMEMLEDIKEYHEKHIPDFTINQQIEEYRRDGNKIIRKPLQYVNPKEGIDVLEFGVKIRNPLVFMADRPKVERV